MSKFAILFCVLLFVGMIGVSTVFLVASQKAIFPRFYQGNHPQDSELPEIVDKDIRKTFSDHPMNQHGLEFQSVEFPVRKPLTKVGKTNIQDRKDEMVRGWYIPAKKSKEGKEVGVIGIHGAGVDRREFSRHFKYFNDAGYSFLAIDCLDHGLSDGKSRGVTLGEREQYDVRAALRFAKNELKWDKVIVFGTSQGGASAMMAIANKSRIVDAAIIENAFSSRVGVIRDAFKNVLRGKDVFDTSGDDKTVHVVKKMTRLIPDFVIDWMAKFTIMRMNWISRGVTGFGVIPVLLSQAFTSLISGEPLCVPTNMMWCLGPDVIDHVRWSTDIPMMMMHSQTDDVVLAQNTMDMAAEREARTTQRYRNFHTSVWYVDGAFHGNILNFMGVEAYSRRVLYWLKYFVPTEQNQLPK